MSAYNRWVKISDRVGDLCERYDDWKRARRYKKREPTGPSRSQQINLDMLHAPMEEYRQAMIEQLNQEYPMPRWDGTK